MATSQLAASSTEGSKRTSRGSSPPIRGMQRKGKITLANTITTGDSVRDIIWIYGQPGVGKTSFMAAMSGVFVVVTAKEPGLGKLIDQNRVGETPHPPPIETWEDFASILEDLVDSDHEYTMVGIDSITDVAELARDYVVRTEYDGSQAKYSSSWGAGTTKYRGLLSWMLGKFFELTRRSESVGVVMTSGAEAHRRNDPQVGEYHQWQPQIEKNAFEVLAKGSDIILFLRHDAQLDRDGRAVSGTVRVMYTEGDNTFVAKNRHGLPRQINMGLSGEESRTNLGEAIVASK